MGRISVSNCLFIALLLGSTATATPGPVLAGSLPEAISLAEEHGRTVRVVDGDTVVLAIEGRPVCVRLIGVDTPETVHPTKPVERFGRESAAFLKNLIGNQDLRVAYEHPAGPRRLDRYGRTLGYLYLEPDGLFVNQEIIARGYGHAYTKYPFRFIDDFRLAEKSARENKVGLWAPEVEGTDESLNGHADSQVLDFVYLTAHGSKYHSAGCRYLGGNGRRVPLDEVSNRYSPCSVCRPSSALAKRSEPAPLSISGP